MTHDPDERGPLAFPHPDDTEVAALAGLGGD
jgi:hypothetical protein